MKWNHLSILDQICDVIVVQRFQIWRHLHGTEDPKPEKHDADCRDNPKCWRQPCRSPRHANEGFHIANRICYAIEPEPTVFQQRQTTLFILKSAKLKHPHSHIYSAEAQEDTKDIKRKTRLYTTRTVNLQQTRLVQHAHLKSLPAWHHCGINEKMRDSHEYIDYNHRDSEATFQ